MQPAPDFATRITALCPGFIAGDRIRARKSDLLAGTLDGTAVIAKRVAKPSPVWEFYLQHELAIYRAFAAHPSGIRTPRLVAATHDLLVIERITGAPLATQRRPAARLPIRTIGAILDAHAQLATYAHTPASQKAPRARLRDRLLEDPTDPGWVRDGIRLCGKRGTIDAELAREIDQVLATSPATFQHGDLLLRNIISDDEDDLVLVDWECAGMHPRDWDLALVWTQLAGPARTLVEDAVRESTTRWRAFLGLVIFAFARELRFVDAFPSPNAATRDGIAAELADTARRFRE
ncbi:MAG: phosphotransferase [Kofleriaceae bacterium]